jgi:hypothetical protein
MFISNRSSGAKNISSIIHILCSILDYITLYSLLGGTTVSEEHTASIFRVKWLVPTYQTALCRNTEDHIIKHRRYNLKSI